MIEFLIPGLLFFDNNSRSKYSGFNAYGCVKGVYTGFIEAVFKKEYIFDTTLEKTKYINNIKKNVGNMVIFMYKRMKKGVSFGLAIDAVIETLVEGAIDSKYKFYKKELPLSSKNLQMKIGDVAWNNSDYSGYIYRKKQIGKINGTA